MTGPFDRLRAWVGSFFGDDTTEMDDGDDPASEAPSERVVHRDDRPLETPSTMDRPDPPTPGAEDERVDSPDAERGAADDASEAPVSIPDAESAGDVTAAADSAASTSPGDASGTSVAPDAEADAAFTCSVCGTAVDDPSEPCPLCRSTDVVPVSDGSDPETPTRDGRTSVSAADDEAVDRLRDVRDEG
ncbi:MAG: hypothetical protein V5A16_06365 [Haloplanus sp.]